ncbi:MAG: hypothetical protein IJ049_00465 [Oscillospiraceae bacterium]|nr:hypothetical protein [Oscillospiraceae bacterium]
MMLRTRLTLGIMAMPVTVLLLCCTFVGYPSFSKRGRIFVYVMASFESTEPFHQKKWNIGWKRNCGISHARCPVFSHVFSSKRRPDRLVAGHHPKSTALRHVLRKLGFVYTGDEYYEPTGLYHPSYKLMKGQEAGS